MESNNKVMYGIIAVVFLFFFLVMGAYLYQQNKDKAADASNKTTPDRVDETPDNPEVLATSFESEKGVAITLTSPTRGATVASPLNITGMVPGTWSHEGQFTLRLLDGDGNVITESAGTLDGDWMSANQVPFTATLTFDIAPMSGSSGLLVLEKSNPSDLEQNSDSLSVLIYF